MSRRTPLAPLLLLLLALPPLSSRAAPGREEARARLSEVEGALEAWDVPAARAALEGLKAQVGGELEPVRHLEGRVAFEEGRYEEAVGLLESSGTQDAPGSYLRLAKETRAITREYARAESAHFIFTYPKGKDEVLVPYALEALEAVRKALLEDLGYAPPGKVRVEVVQNAKELSRVSTLTLEQIRTTGTIAICKFNKLMVTSPKAVLKGYDWLDTLAHEYVHLVVSQKSRNTTPIWLHEGMAKYLESRWRGKAGLAMSPSTLALLGRRVRKNDLIPFQKMHPSIAMLPSAEDAATAFAEVFFAIDYVHGKQGPAGLRTILEGLKAGRTDKQAVEAAMGQPFPAFEKAWLAHVKAQPFPTELLPLDEQKVTLKEDAKGKGRAEDEARQKKGKEISFGDFAEISEVPARRFAHLGELMRERNRDRAAAEEYGKAYKLVGDKYESLSNKYALALLETERLDEAQSVLEGSLKLHPTSPATFVHLGRIHLHRSDFKRARDAYLEALASDPFDPEVHLALLKSHTGLGQKALADRARQAAVVLTGLTPEAVDAVAQKLGKSPAEAEPLAGPSPEPGAARPAAPAPRPDAGTIN